MSIVSSQYAIFSITSMGNGAKTVEACPAIHYGPSSAIHFAAGRQARIEAPEPASVRHSGGLRTHRDPPLREVSFRFTHGVFPEVENAGREHGVGLALLEHLHHVVEVSRASAGDHGNADAF